MFTVLLNRNAYGAASATMYLTPATGSITQGSDIQLTIKVAAGTNKIIAAQACIQYDKTKLQLIQTDTTSSPLPNEKPSDPGYNCPPGELQVSQYGTSFPSNTFNLAVLTFRALQANTSDTLSFNNTKSYVMDNATTDSSGTYVSILSGTTGSTITLSPVPVPAPTAQPATPAPTITKTPAPSATPTASTPPKTTVTPRPTTPVPAVIETTQSPVAPKAVSTSPTVPKKDAAKPSSKKISSAAMLYLVGGVLSVAILAGIAVKLKNVLIAPKVSGYTPIAAPPSVAAPSVDLTQLPDPTLPSPSSVVSPTRTQEIQDTDFQLSDKIR